MLALADPLFDVLLTLDKKIPYQQDLMTVRIAVLIIRARSNRIQDPLAVIPECVLPRWSAFSPGKWLASVIFLRVECFTPRSAKEGIVKFGGQWTF